MIFEVVLLGAYLCSVSHAGNFTWGGLYPRESESREVKNLDGLWNFRLSPLHDADTGFRDHWYSQPLAKTGSVQMMAVPSSYNDITEDKELRDHIGWAWYDRSFLLPKRWQMDNQRVVLRLGSAHYYSIIYLNGKQITTHEGGHLPIMADITQDVVYGTDNWLTVAINNILTPETIPQGSIEYKNDTSRYPKDYFVQNVDFDFTNYAGIHRPVFIYTTPQTYIHDILVTTDIDGTSGLISYNVTYHNSTKYALRGTGCSVKVFDKLGSYVANAIGCTGKISIHNATFWWPYLMNDDPGYMYTLQVGVSDAEGNMDIYPQKVGIRVIGWNSTTLTINGEKLYLRGCGKHEDSDIRGKGVDYALIVKDFSLLKWLGANSFRTSHYPYAEEIMDMADHEGIMVVDESPAVGLNGFGSVLLSKHISVMQELVRRDKNRPSVIMWSVGNEPRSQQDGAGDYFKSVVKATKLVDLTRPVTCVLSVGMLLDKAAKSLDIILVNRYFSWYSDTGHTEVIKRQTVVEFTGWHLLHKKPVMISEYGAGSLAGFHQEPSFTWTEEYQAELMIQNFQAFDQLRDAGFFVGEMIWNFADFATPQEYNRPGACMKGLFTRQRQPKMAGHLMRWRYWHLAETLNNYTKPNNSFNLGLLSIIPKI